MHLHALWIALTVVPAAEEPPGMVLVPAGTFTLGRDGEAPDEGPAHPIELRAFWIDRLEVTNRRYSEFVHASGHPAPPDWAEGKPDPNRLDHPVVNVSWFDAIAYARWAGKRLPGEAEWERAARGAEGRLLPWEGGWDPSRANIDLGDGKARLARAGSLPSGATPEGVLDLLGNAWEWTADWYGPYPGNGVPSIHHGEKYRVVRGGGAIDFYPPANAKRATARARVQPFGRYDSIGFRCAIDAVEPRRISPDLKPPSEREIPRLPIVESPAEVAGRFTGGIPIEISGAGGPGIAAFGVPFPEGILRSTRSLRAGELPIQARPVATWRDGSVRWALVDLAVDPAVTRSLRLRWDGEGPPPLPVHPVRILEEGETVRIDSGAAEIVVRTGSLPWLEVRSGAEEITGIEESVEAVDDAGKTENLRQEAPTAVRVEDRGPLRARIRVEGWLVDGKGIRTLRYRVRLDIRAGDGAIGIVHGFTHLGDRPMLRIQEYSLRFGGAVVREGEAARFGGRRGEVLRGGPGSRIEQLSDTAYRFTAPGAPPRDGTRAEGWATFGKEGRGLLALKGFWEQFPKALALGPDGAVLSLWTGLEPFEADAGLAKSHEIVLAIQGAGDSREAILARLRDPLFGIVPPSYACPARALGDLAPYDLSRFPIYETQVEADSDLLFRNRPSGMRHHGDYYYGGPYKGLNAYMDLEYDVPYNHFLQFVRTGARKYLDAGVAEARHQGDIDFRHDGGPQWKHSPRHTTTPADLGHVFLRGLVAWTWITGEPEGLETARLLGDWLLRVIANPSSQGNERQIGWTLYALTGIYEATWDPRYLEAMKANIDRLLAGLDALGRFSIRWDNRISFFYGITLSGFVRYHEVTGDPRIPDAVARIVRRLHGFYPEYAGRTLEGLAWLYARTGDPEVRLTCHRTWESTLAWRAFDLGGMSIFTVRFLPMVEALGLAPPAAWAIPDVGPVEDGLRRSHYRAASGEFWIEAVDGGPLDLLLLRHVGPTAAVLRASDRAGQEVALRTLPAAPDLLQHARLPLPSGGPWRIELRSDSTRAWDIITPRPTRRVFHAPDWKGLEALTPRIQGRPAAGAREISLVLEAQGEGFKGAVVYDPEGSPAGVLSRFIDFGDDLPHTYELKVPIPETSAGDLWAIDLQSVSVKEARGLLPWWSTVPEAFFLPRP